MRRFIGGIALVAGAVLMLGAGTPQPDGFKIQLTKIDHGWSATCLSGCDWTKASFSCKTDCPAMVSNTGLVTVEEPRPDHPTFLFKVEATANGWQATGVTGTGWKELGWSCGKGACAGVVTEHGVSGVVN